MTPDDSPRRSAYTFNKKKTIRIPGDSRLENSLNRKWMAERWERKDL